MKTALLVLCLVQEEGAERARKLLEEAAAKLKAAPAIHFESEYTQGEAGSEHARIPTRSKALVQKPDKMRWESAGPNGDRLQIYDGKFLWDLDRTKGVFTKYSQSRGLLKSQGTDNPLLRLYLDKDPARILQRARDVAVSRKKEEGQEFDVLAWKGKDPYGRSWIVEYSLWLDSARMPRRFTQSWEWQGRLDMRAMEYVRIDMAPKVGDDAFAFKPPEGAREQAPRHGSASAVPDTEEAKRAQKILIEVHKAFSVTEALSYETEASSKSEGHEASPVVRWFITLKRPDMFRQEQKSEAGGSWTITTDGESMWTIMPQAKNFTVRELTTAGHRLRVGDDPLIHLFFEGEHPEIFIGMQDIAVTRESLDGEPCDVVGWSQSQPEYTMRYKYWVDSSRRPRQRTIESDYKGRSFKSVTTYKSFDLKPAIPEGHFTFVPGPGWTDRSDERLGESLVKVGKAAPDFEGTDAEGRAVRLSAFQGRPVVLVFGHYAHPSELTRVQEFHEEFSKKGVTVIAVILAADGPRLDPKKHTFGILRPKDKSVAKAFGVDYWSSGMYLLDGEGKVLAATYGNDPLRKAVDDAVGPPKKD